MVFPGFSFSKQCIVLLFFSVFFISSPLQANKYDDFKKLFVSTGNAGKAIKSVDLTWKKRQGFYKRSNDNIGDVDKFYQKMSSLVKLFDKNDRRALEAIRLFENDDFKVSIKDARAAIKYVKDNETKVKILVLMANNTAVREGRKLIRYIAPFFNSSANLYRALEMMSLPKRFDFEKNYHADYSDYTDGLIDDFDAWLSHSNFLTVDLLVYMVAKHISIANGRSVHDVLDHMDDDHYDLEGIKEITPLQWHEKNLLHDLCKNNYIKYCKVFKDLE